jgi:sarcosine oxidase delta subunit
MPRGSPGEVMHLRGLRKVTKDKRVKVTLAAFLYAQSAMRLFVEEIWHHVRRCRDG